MHNNQVWALHNVKIACTLALLGVLAETGRYWKVRGEEGGGSLGKGKGGLTVSVCGNNEINKERKKGRGAGMQCNFPPRSPHPATPSETQEEEEAV